MPVRNSSDPTTPEYAAETTPTEAAEQLTADLEELVPEFVWVPEIRRIPDKQGYGIPMALGHLDQEADAEWVLEFLFLGIDPYSYKRNQNEPTLKYGPVPASRHREEESTYPVLDWSWIGTKLLEPGTTYPSQDDLEDGVGEVREHISKSLLSAKRSMDTLQDFNDCLT